MEQTIKAIVREWYNDGCSTWEYQGGPGEDGMFGGTFHSITRVKKIDNDTYNFSMDCGSAYYAHALNELVNRLEKIGYTVNGNIRGSVKITKI